MYTIHDSWKTLFNKYVFDLDKIYEISEVYPPKYLVFRGFEMDDKKIRIVCIGQDCFHTPNQAHGLSFSVPTKMG